MRNVLPLKCKDGFLCGSVGKKSACNAGDPGSIPGSGRCPGEGMATHSIFLFGKSQGQSSLATVHGDTKRWTGLGD